MTFLTQKFVNFIIQVTNLKLSKSSYKYTKQTRLYLPAICIALRHYKLELVSFDQLQ